MTLWLGFGEYALESKVLKEHLYVFQNQLPLVAPSSSYIWEILKEDFFMWNMAGEDQSFP